MQLPSRATRAHYPRRVHSNYALSRKVLEAIPKLVQITCKFTEFDSGTSYSYYRTKLRRNRDYDSLTMFRKRRGQPFVPRCGRHFLGEPVIRLTVILGRRFSAELALHKRLARP